MIDYYEFDNANVGGDKEAVIVPNPPTLINKLSANETNNFKDKINEVIDAINPLTPIPYPELRLKFKGEGNTLSTLQVGDIVHGFADADTIWTNARYEGGDITDRGNYTLIPEPAIVTYGKFLVFKAFGNEAAGVTEVGDVVQGIAEGTKFEGVYNGPDPLLLSSYTIYNSFEL